MYCLILLDIISLTIDDNEIIIYRRDEGVKDWRTGASHLVNMKATFQFCHMLSMLMFHCHITNGIIGNMSMDQIELGFDKKVIKY